MRWLHFACRSLNASIKSAANACSLAPHLLSLVMSHADRENALREVRGAVSKLPVGTSEQDVSAVRDQAMDGIWKEREKKSKISTLI